MVEQLMGQIRNMEDTISSVFVALEYGPNMATTYRLNQECIYTVYNDIETISRLNQQERGVLYTINNDMVLLSVPKFTANLYCICPSIPQIFTKADAVQICGKFCDT